jgi:adenylyltransferase/sulfurtransferase
MVLPEIGEAGQKRISAGRVLCVGAGGLGSPALYYLAAAGVGHIGIVDGDVVDESNLQRQILFNEDDVGQPKAIMAAERLRAIHSDIRIQHHQTRLTARNCEDIFEDYDFIIDGSDNFDTSFLINDTCVKLGTAWAYASILGFDGQLAVFGAHEDGPCLRCLFPHRPTQNVLNCAEAGILGPVAGILGSMQALEAIKYLAGLPVVSNFITLDLKTYAQSRIRLARDTDCPLCSLDKEEITLMSDEISIEEAFEALDNGAILVDVREQNEWDAGHIPQAQFMPLSDLMNGKQVDLPKDVQIVLHCKSGKRSMTALQILRAQGFDKLSSMRGGYDLWVMQKGAAA